jgi:hypothetical protein
MGNCPSGLELQEDVDVFAVVLYHEFMLDGAVV